MPELYKRNPEACLLQCVDAKVYDMAAMVDDECWCSPAAEVEIFAQPEFSNETCGRECLDTLDNKLRFNCSHLAGFFSLKSNVESELCAHKSFECCVHALVLALMLII